MRVDVTDRVIDQAVEVGIHPNPIIAADKIRAIIQKAPVCQRADIQVRADSTYTFHGWVFQLRTRGVVTRVLEVRRAECQNCKDTGYYANRDGTYTKCTLHP